VIRNWVTGKARGHEGYFMRWVAILLVFAFLMGSAIAQETESPPENGSNLTQTVPDGRESEASATEESPAVVEVAAETTGPAATAAYATLLQAAAAGDLYGALPLIGGGEGLAATDEQGRTPLLAATASGNAHLVTSLLEAGADISVRDLAGNSALHLAAAANDVYMIQHLHARGLDPTLVNHAKYQPIHVAAEHDAPEAALKIIQLGAIPSERADVDQRTTPLDLAYKHHSERFIEVMAENGYRVDFNTAIAYGDTKAIKEHLNENIDQLSATSRIGNTPILGACSAGNIEVIDLLVDWGANIHDYNARGQCCLSIAMINGNFDLVRYLLEKGVDINMAPESAQFDTVLHQQVRFGDAEKVAFILSLNPNAGATNLYGQTPMHVAVIENKPEIVRLMSDAGVFIDPKERDARTPLHFAATQDNATMAALLLELGANIESSDRQRQTPLHAAVVAGSMNAMNLLLEKGADMKWRDRDGRDALHLAAIHQRMNCLEKLLALGADINTVDREQRTPLHNVMQVGTQNIALQLIDAGADVSVQDKLLQTPLHLALTAGIMQVVSRLLDAGADVNVEDRYGQNALFHAATAPSTLPAELLVTKGMAINVTDRVGQTPLHLAVSSGESDTVNYLLQRGAEVNVADRNGWMPLHLACRRGNVIVVRDLLAKGAQADAVNREGAQPAHVSAEAGHWGPIQLLELRGIDLATPDEKGNAPLHIAAREGHHRLCRLMLSRGASLAVTNSEGHTPLAMAEMNSPGRVDTPGLTPLQVSKIINARQTIFYLRAVTLDTLAWAAKKGDSGTLDTLLSLHPEYAQSCYRSLPLTFEAVRHGQEDALAVLLKHGAPIEEPRHHPAFTTALHEAALGGHTSLALWLLAHGSDKNQIDAGGRTAAEVARLQSHAETATAIEQFAGEATPTK
jgi:ankyrin repeat protein